MLTQSGTALLGERQGRTFGNISKFILKKNIYVYI